MNDNKKILDNFQQLTHEDKLNKVINMLKEIKGVSQVSSDILDLIKKNPDNIDDELLFEIYTNIVNLGSDIEGLEKEENQIKLESTMNKLKKIQERETKEKIKEEGELDNMLKEIENIEE